MKELEGSKLHIIDSSALARTGFYYFKDLGCKVDGRFVNTGAMYALLKLFKEIPLNEKIIFCWDSSENERKNEYEGYKAGRVKDGLEEYYKGMDLTRDLLLQSGFMVVWADGYEADDFVIAIKEFYEEVYDNIIIHTNDHDLAQLIDTKTYIKVPVTKRSDICLENYEEITGVPYNSILLYKSLVGCASDNVKGVRGFGQKSFERLIEDLGEDFDIRMIREEESEEYFIRDCCRLNDGQVQQALDSWNVVAPRRMDEFEFIDRDNIQKDVFIDFLVKYKMKSIIKGLSVNDLHRVI